MEPISAAIAAFGAIKAGVSAGREITSMAKDLGKMWDSCEAVQQDHNKKKNRQILSANEEALSTFVNKQKAKDLEEELRELIVWTRGLDAWQELLRLRVDIKRERKEAIAKVKRERAEKQEAILTVVAVVLVLGLIVGGGAFFIWWKLVK
jgi:hypothetical protein|tara:strand:+ start:582 stop:1031 length:450 start_codon:yes stop_codon:yes gene_type:complete